MARGLEITPQMAAQHLDALTDIVARAAAVTLAFAPSEVAHRTKDDMSPVTAADEASEALILAGLAKLFPGAPVVAEEETAAQRLPSSIEPSFLSVDPLDGTREFLAGRDEFTVNIGIVTNGVPIAGLIAAPARGLLWRGIVGGVAERMQLQIGSGRAKGYGCTPIHTRPAPSQLTVATSRSHLDKNTEDLLARLPLGERYPCGSSVKFCYLAQGDVDMYPRLAPTCEWDLAAGCAILAAAGGAVVRPQGGPLQFGRMSEKFLVPGFIAVGDPSIIATLPAPVL